MMLAVGGFVDVLYQAVNRNLHLNGNFHIKSLVQCLAQSKP